MASPDFGKSVERIFNQGGGTDYAHHITSGPSGFSDFPTVLL